jgi:hypothetical protein
MLLLLRGGRINLSFGIMFLFSQKVRALGCVLLCLNAGTLPSPAQTQAASVPSGYFTLNIAAGTAGSRTLSTISLPMLSVASAGGQMVGQVTGLTANTISNANGNWSAGQLSQAATPYLVQFTSGAATGRTFLISSSAANTATTLTIDSSDAATTDLTTIGAVAGTDTYQIIAAKTLSSLFGTPDTTGIQGGTLATSADQVQIYNGAAWLSYYYNTAAPGWMRVGPPIASPNVVIRPETAMIYSRAATSPLSLMISGVVPRVNRQTLVSNAGLTFLAHDWPAGLTLAGSNIQNIPGWSQGAQSVADVVQMYDGAAWLQYYHNGTNWVRIGSGDDSDAVTIPAGSAVILEKKNSSSGQNVLAQPLPYTL